MIKFFCEKDEPEFPISITEGISVLPVDQVPVK